MIRTIFYAIGDANKLIGSPMRFRYKPIARSAFSALE